MAYGDHQQWNPDVRTKAAIYMVDLVRAAEPDASYVHLQYGKYLGTRVKGAARVAAPPNLAVYPQQDPSLKFSINTSTGFWNPWRIFSFGDLLEAHLDPDRPDLLLIGSDAVDTFVAARRLHMLTAEEEDLPEAVTVEEDVLFLSALYKNASVAALGLQPDERAFAEDRLWDWLLAEERVSAPLAFGALACLYGVETPAAERDFIVDLTLDKVAERFPTDQSPKSPGNRTLQLLAPALTFLAQQEVVAEHLQAGGSTLPPELVADLSERKARQEEAVRRVAEMLAQGRRRRDPPTISQLPQLPNPLATGRAVLTYGSL